MIFGRRSSAQLHQMGAKLVASEYVVQSLNLKRCKVSINKRDTYRKPNGKKVFLWHKFEREVEVLPEHIIRTIKTKEVETNDWYVSHRETYTKKYEVLSLSEEGLKYAIEQYFKLKK